MLSEYSLKGRQSLYIATDAVSEALGMSLQDASVSSGDLYAGLIT